jgi:arginine/lysine/ornithine decarboxylase
LSVTENTEQPVRERIDGEEKEWVALASALGRICAQNCGLFPPCTPLIVCGEEVTEEKIALLQSARHTFGLKNGQIAVWKRAKKE